GEELHVVAPDPLVEIGDVGQRDDRVPERIGGKMIDEIDDAVLETADIESVNHMGDAGTRVRARTNPRIHHRCCAALRNAASMGSFMAAVNSCRVARTCGSPLSVGVKMTTHATGSP